MSETQIHSVGLIGLGALGVLFGERLLSGGAKLTVIADEARAARCRREGVTCNGRPVPFDLMTPAQARPVDLLIFATKAGGLSAAMETAAAFVGEKTLLLSVLNGVSSEEARLVCVMLELDLVNQKIPSDTEISQMKFDIARAMLRKDELNEGLKLTVEE